MKRIKALMVALLATLSLTLTSCNEDISFGSFSFHYVHVQMYSMDKPTHFEVETWKDDEGGIELKIKDHGRILLGDGTYMLYDTSVCPICGRVDYK